ncbi:uncharacterized protein [Elaeis guineensis]|uniref:uncharacterized protein n=1 Tax=Elaeis guineensis var. tenera TaxID=51953 RepID=UPI003C6D4F9A
MATEEGRDEHLSSLFPLVPTFQFQALDPPIVTYLGLGFGIGLGFLLFTRSRSIKPLSTAIMVADGAIKGTKVLQDLHSPSPKVIVFASKALIKGYKASKRFIPAGTNLGIHPLIAKRLKAYLSAINLVRYATSPLYADGFLGLGLLKGGYKFSKNFLKVLEGFMGLQLDSALKNGVDTLGLLVRVVFVARELKQWIVIGWPRKRRHECGFARRIDMRYGACLCYERTNFDGDCRYVTGFPVENFPKLERAVISEMPSEPDLSELLCLSIPVHEVIPMNLL